MHSKDRLMPMKVLIIEDEEDIRRIAAVSLSKVGGMSVAEAGSGPEGLQKARSEMPDVILLDVMMPLIDGPATLQALKSDPATASIPIIFLTAKAMEDELGRLKELGAAGVLVKPFDPLLLPNQVNALLSAFNKGNANG
jgi:two-component system, OmpR family, response regulator